MTECKIKLSPERAEYEFYTYSPVTNSINFQANNDKKLMFVSDALGRQVKKFKTQLCFTFMMMVVLKRIIVD